MFEIVLFEPEIPPNTGNIIRLCAATGCTLHLVEPLGFDFTDKALRRAGLDYHEFATVRRHESWPACQAALAAEGKTRIHAFTTKGKATLGLTAFQPGDVFLFGPESRGLPAGILESLPAEQRLRLPMLPERRSLNLANTVAIVAYEAWRQQGFAGGL